MHRYITGMYFTVLGTIMDSDGRAGLDTHANIRKERYFDAIQNHATLITENIEVNDFSSYLIQDRAFTIDQLQEVTCERTRMRRAEAFVRQLKGKNADQIRAAVESMRRTYSHVYAPLNRGIIVMNQFIFVSFSLVIMCYSSLTNELNTYNMGYTLLDARSIC